MSILVLSMPVMGWLGLVCVSPLPAGLQGDGVIEKMLSGGAGAVQEWRTNAAAACNNAGVCYQCMGERGKAIKAYEVRPNT